MKSKELREGQQKAHRYCENDELKGTETGRKFTLTGGMVKTELNLLGDLGPREGIPKSPQKLMN